LLYIFQKYLSLSYFFICVYIWLYIYLYLPLAFLRDVFMNSLSLSACFASWQVVKVKCETCSPKILEAPEECGGFWRVAAIVNEPKSYPSHAKYTQTAQAMHSSKKVSYAIFWNCSAMILSKLFSYMPN